MTTDRRHIADHVFAGGDRLFLDTNAWMAIVGPTASRQPDHVVYTEAWKQMRSASSQVFVHPLVLAELVNRWLRMAYDESRAAEAGTDYKSWRSMPDFHTAAALAANDLAPVLDHCSWCSRALKKRDLEAAVTALPRGRRDLNDHLIVRLCELNDLTLITHDGDFRGAGVPILTANRYLLR